MKTPKCGTTELAEPYEESSRENVFFGAFLPEKLSPVRGCLVGFR
jgi:hypothetical protein